VDRLERIFQLHQILAAARMPVPRERLMREMECSRATLTRTMQLMRLHLGAPLEYDRERNGYYYDRRAAHPYELPGLWFNASELYALLAMRELLSDVQPGLLDGLIEPLRRRIEQILAHQRLQTGELPHRVRILRMAARQPEPRAFKTVTEALLRRRRLHLRYHGRARDTLSEREVSPQRLVHYRDNWYLDAWCHARQALRTFALDRIREARGLEEPADEIPDADLDAHYASAYGIFAGSPRHTAVLRFTPERARWVADESWHPQQIGQYRSDGGFDLHVPYSDPRELLLDILRYGPDVEVVAPPALRREVARRLREALDQYEDG